ncbi:RluA family pseudouridine synthase [Chloroflexota bacterium]
MTNTVSLSCHLPSQRLDTYIAGLQQDISRSQIQRLIREGHVRVNGRVARPSARLRQGDQIHIHLPDASPEGVVPEEFPLKIVYQDDQVVVVDKPAGLTVHPAPGHPHGTLVNALLARYPELEGVGDRLRPGLVHRLDADTSGLMVIARTPLAHESLSRQIKERAITKVYLALVRGHPEPSKGTVEAPIARHPRSRQRMGIVPGGRYASTQYCTLRLFRDSVPDTPQRRGRRAGLHQGAVGEGKKGYALLEVRPHTGRTHQIRVHLSSLGHPVAGDVKYGGRVPFLRRQFLHAHRLGFRLPPTERYVEFTSPLPLDLEEALGILAPG